MKTIVAPYMLTALILQLQPSTFYLRDTDIYFYVLGLFMLLPEITVILSKSFRGWMRIGAEDADNKFEKSDQKDLFALYISLWCARTFIIASFLSMFKNVEVNNLVLTYSFSGMFGAPGIVVLQKIVSLIPHKK